MCTLRQIHELSARVNPLEELWSAPLDSLEPNIEIGNPLRKCVLNPSLMLDLDLPETAGWELAYLIIHTLVVDAAQNNEIVHAVEEFVAVTLLESRPSALARDDVALLPNYRTWVILRRRQRQFDSANRTSIP